MIDPHGEYAAAFNDKAIVYRACHEASSSNGVALELKLPYWLMSSDELRSLIIGKTEFEATSQNISFVKGWSNQPATVSKLKEIADKWTCLLDSTPSNILSHYV